MESIPDRIKVVSSKSVNKSVPTFQKDLIAFVSNSCINFSKIIGQSCKVSTPGGRWMFPLPAGFVNLHVCAFICEKLADEVIVYKCRFALIKCWQWWRNIKFIGRLLPSNTMPLFWNDSF